MYSLFTLSQVARWPKKEEEEQPMFGEEYDWWVKLVKKHLYHFE